MSDAGKGREDARLPVAKGHMEGVTLWRKETFKQALSEWFVRKPPSTQIKPDFAGAHYDLGFAYVRSGMYREAIETLKQAIQIKPDLADAHYNLGISYLVLNNQSGALGEYNILKNLNPQSADKLFDLI